MFLSYLPLFHTFGRWFEMFGAVFWGATYCFLENPSVEALVAGMRTYRPTVFISVPKKWIQLYEEVERRADPMVASDADIADLAALQTRLLDNAVRLLKPGGTLVYSTCSLEPEEGEAQVAALLARNDSLRIEPIRPDEPFGDTEWAQSSGVLRTFPFQLQLNSPEWNGMDGFFAARLVAAG